MTRLIALLVLTAVAVGIALVLQRRRPDPPSAPSYRAPSQLDRNDFAGGPGTWLVALFASTTCDTCPRAWSTVEAAVGELGTDEVVAQRLDVQTESEVHARYRIDGVPTTVIVGPDGVVAQAFFGPVSVDQVHDALVSARGAHPPA